MLYVLFWRTYEKKQNVLHPSPIFMLFITSGLEEALILLKKKKRERESIQLSRVYLYLVMD